MRDSADNGLCPECMEDDWDPIGFLESWQFCKCALCDTKFKQDLSKGIHIHGGTPEEFETTVQRLIDDPNCVVQEDINE